MVWMVMRMVGMVMRMMVVWMMFVVMLRIRNQNILVVHFFQCVLNDFANLTEVENFITIGSMRVSQAYKFLINFVISSLLMLIKIDILSRSDKKNCEVGCV